MQRNAVSLGVLALAASGCIVFAKSETREVAVGTEESEPASFGGFVGWDITTRIEADMANVVVTAAHVQTCTRLRYEVYDEIESETTDVWTPEPDGEYTVLLPVEQLVFLPVTALTGIVAGIVVVTHHDTKTRKTRSLDTVVGRCPQIVANTQVELTLPSGSVLTGTTDSSGRARFAIPETEPDHGTAITRVADQTRSSSFFRTTEACKRARDEMFSRVLGAAAVEERSQLLRSLPTACGDPRAHAWALMATVALEAVNARCESLERLGGQVRTIDRRMYDSVFVIEPDIAQCLDGRAATRQRLEHRSACIAIRRERMRSAEQIEDLKERTRILASLPNCDSPGAAPTGSKTPDKSIDAGAFDSSATAPTNNLPDGLDRRMIASGIASVRAQMTSCGESPAKGTVKVHVKVGDDGRVASVSVESTPDAKLGACVAAAMRNASFAKTRNGGSFSYPIDF